MNFITYTECPISINGENFYATRASLSSTASLHPDRVVGGSLEGYGPTGPIADSVNLDYYVSEANDSIMSLTGNLPCSGSLGGVNFSGAYLTKYSINIAPYRPIEVSVSFDVYSGFYGSLNGQSGDFNPSLIDIANGAHTDLVNFNSLKMGMDNPISIDYNIDCQRTPNYVIGEEHPRYVILGAIGKSMSIKGENIGDLISYSGRSSASMSITPKNINNLSRGQTLECEGVIHSQNLSVSAGGIVDGTISISESYK
jgi:hypothetical protein